jgi:hypothetical protein
MFYKKEDINEVITCGICSQIYIDPRILPCGEFACNDCIQPALNSENEFACNFCNEKHTPAGKSGFPVNQKILKLLKAPAKAVSRHPRVEELMTKLDELQTDFDSFKFDLDNGVDQINAHCIQLKNQIDLQTEFVIQKAQEISESLRGEIDKYEAVTIETFKRTKHESELVNEKLIQGIQKFHSKTSKYLTEFKIDEKVVEESLIDAEKLSQLLKFRNTWSLVESKMKFIKNEDKLDDYQKIIGSLVNEKTGNFSKIEFCQLNLSVIRDFKSHLNVIGVGDGKYKIFYVNKNGILIFVSLNKSSVENSSYIISRPICNSNIDNLNVVTMEDTFFVGFSLTQQIQRFCFGNQQFETHNKHHFIIKVNSDFCFILFISIEHSIEFMAASK